MSCNTKKKKGALRNAKNYMVKKGAIDKFNKIIDYSLFSKLSKKMRDHGIKEYGITGKWYYSEGGGTVALPNMDLFNQVDKINGIYKSVKKDFMDLATGDNVFGAEEVPTSNVKEDAVDNFAKSSMTLFGGTPTTMSAKEVLNNIMVSGIKSSKYLNDMAQILEVTAESKVKVVNRSKMTASNDIMYYNSKENVIYIAKDALDNLSTDEIVATFLHEVYHERTHKVLSTQHTQEEKDLVRDLTIMYEYVKNKLGNNNDFGYELSNIDEFVTGVFSNKKFGEEVKKHLENTFWDRIKAFFKEYLNIGGTEYTKLLDNILTLPQIQSELTNATLLDVKLAAIKKDYTSDEIAEEIGSLEKTTKKVYNHLESLLAIYEKNSSPTYSKTIRNTLREFEAIEEAYKDSQEMSQSLIVLKYISFMETQMDRMSSRLKASDIEFSSKMYEQMEAYLSAFGLVEEVEGLISNLTIAKKMTPAKSNRYSNKIKQLRGQFESNKSLITALARKDLIKTIGNTKYFKEVEIQYRMKFEKEANNLYKGKGSSAKRERYINNKMAENREVIKERTSIAFEDMMNNTMADIGSTAAIINSEKEFNHPLIQAFTKVQDEMELNYKTEIMGELMDTNEMYDKFMKGKSKNTSNEKLFKNIVTFSKNGEPFLRGDYKIEFYNTFNDLTTEVADVLEEYGMDSLEYKDAVNKKRSWVKDNVVFDETNQTGGVLPNVKWEDNLKDLTNEERDILHFFRTKFAESQENIVLKSKRLSFNLLGAGYMRLPSLEKTMLSDVTNGKGFEAIKTGIKDTFKRREDDLEFGENSNKVFTDLSGKEVSKVPIHFRGKNIKQEDQSMDMFTLLAMEQENSIKFKHKNLVESDLRMFVDVAKASKYSKKVGILGKPMVSWFSKDESPIEISGSDANIIKLLETSLNNRLYDKTSVAYGKIGKADVNKTISLLLGFTSQVGMALNHFGATANVAIGSINNGLEALAGDVIDSSDIGKAMKFYFDNAQGILNDVGNPVDKNIVNLIVQRYNVFGETKELKDAFEKNTKLKALFKGDSLQFMHNSGEHAVQSVLTLAVLNSVKSTNEKGDYVNKDGKVVTEKKDAASLLDMLTKSKDHKIEVSDKLKYTTVDQIHEFDKGGETNVRNVIKQMMLRNQGNYDVRLQPEFQRHWYGKMISMYKKHLMSPLLNRYRGLNTVGQKREDVDYQINYDLNKIDEGYYVSMSRFIYRNVIPNLKGMKLKLITTDFNELNDWEKANIKRSMAEAATIALMSSTAFLLASLAGDDDEAIWFAAYIFKRAQSDLSQYYNPAEAWRILKNPFASLRQIEIITEIIETIVTPWTWNDEYDGGRYMGDKVIVRKIGKLIPIWTRHDLTAKQAYNFIAR